MGYPMYEPSRVGDDGTGQSGLDANPPSFKSIPKMSDREIAEETLAHLRHFGLILNTFQQEMANGGIMKMMGGLFGRRS